MSRRQRQQRRRRNERGGASRTLLLGLGVILAIALIGALGAVGYVVSVAASSPSLASLKPIDKGAVSVVYAADGERLGLHRVRRAPQPRLRGGDPEDAADGHRGDRGPALLQAQGRRLRGRRPGRVKNLSSGKTVQGGSTITMQLVRNLYITKERTFARKIREAKLAEELENVHSKRGSSRATSTTCRTGRSGGQTAIGVQAGRADVLRQAGQGPHARRVGAARRPAAGAVALQPVLRTAPRPARAATRCSTRWPSRG